MSGWKPCISLVPGRSVEVDEVFRYSLDCSLWGLHGAANEENQERHTTPPVRRLPGTTPGPYEAASRRHSARIQGKKFQALQELTPAQALKAVGTCDYTKEEIELGAWKPHPDNPRRHPKPGSPRWEVLKKALFLLKVHGLQ